MYSLEELRCDLTAFAGAVELEGAGFAFARHAQYAILLDRLFRFPVTGSRVRNYDGLGGQLLFAFLHKEGYLHWTDNRLTLEWGRIARAAAACASASRISTTPASTARSSAREPKQLVDLVRDDEFPLSLFYTQLQPKLAPVLER